MRPLKTWLRNLSGDRSGNTTILVAVGMPALIASAGLGVDVSQWFLWKSELQQATDQAALAAAWSRAKNETYHTSQVRGTQDFENNLTATKDFASAPPEGYIVPNSVIGATCRKTAEVLFLWSLQCCCRSFSP